MKKTVIPILLLCMLLMTVSCAMADSIVGDWKGKASTSALPFSLNMSAAFGEDGQFTVSVFGLTAKGTYSAGDQTLTMSFSSFEGLFASQLQSPSNIGQVKIPYTIQDNTLSIAADVQGLDGSATLSRK